MPEHHANPPTLRCYRCGESLASLSLPLSRLDNCPACSVELHVCRMCRHYAPQAPDACTEEDAIEVTRKDTANFCDYFDPDPNAFDGAEKAADLKARAALDSLFGGADEGAGESSALSPEDQLTRQAEDLFRK